MTFPIHGAENDGPTSCVARFIRASAAGDDDATMAELHPDTRAMAEGTPKPPPMRSVTLEAPIEEGERTLIPAKIENEDGSTHAFVFVVRPAGDGLGIDLEASMQATFGASPTEMLEQAMEQIAQPLSEAMGAMTSALGAAFGGDTDQDSWGDAATHVLPTLAEGLVDVAVTVTGLICQQRVDRDRDSNELYTAGEVDICCRFRVSPEFVVTSCSEVTEVEAHDLSGAPLRPVVNEGLGSETYASWERDEGVYGLTLRFFAPDTPLDGLSALRGTIQLNVESSELSELVVEPVSDLLGTSVFLPALGWDLFVAADEDGRFVLRAPYHAFESSLEVELLDASGDDIGSGYNGYGDGETSTRAYDVEAIEVGSLRLRYRGQSGCVAIPFEADGVPLPLWRTPSSSEE